MEKCLFCELKKEWIYEDKDFYSIFDHNPVSPGHALLISKRHAVSILDLNKEEWTQLEDTLQQVINIIEKADKKKLYTSMINSPISDKSKAYCNKMLEHKSLNQKPDGYNIGINDGEAAGRTINHLHIQIIPRYTGDVENHTGGIRHIIPGMGNYKN
jgi:ATP adenylyltransferase